MKATGNRQPLAIVTWPECLEDAHRERSQISKGENDYPRSDELVLLAGCLILAGATNAITHGDSPSLAQVVAIDECDLLADQIRRR